MAPRNNQSQSQLTLQFVHFICKDRYKSGGSTAGLARSWLPCFPSAGKRVQLVEENDLQEKKAFLSVIFQSWSYQLDYHSSRCTRQAETRLPMVASDEQS